MGVLSILSRYLVFLVAKRCDRTLHTILHNFASLCRGSCEATAVNSSVLRTQEPESYSDQLCGQKPHPRPVVNMVVFPGVIPPTPSFWRT